MRFRSSETGWRSLLLSTLLCTGAWAKKDLPGVRTTKIPHVPYKLEYFEDSDVVMFEDRVDRVVWRSDNAGETWKKVDVAAGKLWELQMHEFDPDRAYIITTGMSHWATKDKGKTWEEFYTDSIASIFRPALAFHGGDPDKIIFHTMDCTGIFCEESTMYTTNGFDKNTRFLRANTEGCHWAKASKEFTTGQKDLDDNRILCVAKGQYSPWRKDFRLVISDDYFVSNGKDRQEFEPQLDFGRTVQGIVDIEPQKRHLITAASASGTDEMALYVTNDTVKWHRAEFPHDHKLTQKAYTILEGTNYSIQIDVMNTRPSNPMGALFTSNSNGTYFTKNIEHTNRNFNGLVDFEKVTGVQGIVIVNVVDNWEDVEKTFMEKKKKTSKISFDDGRTWQALKSGSKDLHLHSVTELDNSGRVFSSPAPGLVMGNGNTGDYLDSFSKANLYVSDDAGVTWHQALEGPHKYEFGDQGSVLVAMNDRHTNEVKFSLNHGKDWKSVSLESEMRPLQLLTTQDSTSLKFLLLAMDESNEDTPEYYTVALDFEEMHEGKCKSSDIETWWARVDEAGKPTCLMGHTQSYQRRKADADCFMKKEFQDPVPDTKDCDCTDADFECDYNFVRSDDGKECKQNGNLVLPKGACEAFGPDDTFLGSSGWRLIPGNTCKRVGDKQKDDPVKHKCSTAVGPPASGNGNSTETSFTGSRFHNHAYLQRTDVSVGKDETVVMRIDQDQTWLTHDHGKTWTQILKGEEIMQIYTHPYFNDVVFFLTRTETVFYSVDRGENIRSFTAPLPPNHDVTVMNFHPKNKDWIIWMGQKCEGLGDCHMVASVTQDRGDDWKVLQRYVRRCEFINEAPPQQRDDKLIYCEVREKENNDPNNPWRLVSSTDFFSEPPQVHFSNVVDFATMSEFIVVATKDEAHQTLKVDTSVDGSTFANVSFPHGFTIDHKKQSAYTVLDSSTHSVFLHVTTNDDPGYEYGSIMKSNSNGTDYVLSLSAVDRDGPGYVDFEKMFHLQGASIVNVVANANSKDYKKEQKKLKTMMTHNDGAEWSYVKVPPAPADGKQFGCIGSLEKCSLNIHGYTERADKSHTYSSQSAIGLMFGVGNVGEFLTPYDSADTFMTADGGVNWKFVKEGTHMWEFGDQGSILVIVKENALTNVVYYSLDEGDTWIEYRFSDSDMAVDDLTTVPDDNARNFLLWGTIDGKLTAVNLDFSGLTDKQCKLDEEHVTDGDYYLWTPKHPLQDDDCLFGHVSQYHRKRTDRDCYNGPMIPSLHDIAKNCTCTRRDFECDFNYERQSDGSCALVNGYSPPDHAQMCRFDPNVVEFMEPTGYRRVPLTTCQGGNEMDANTAHPCPGHEDEFERKHAASGWAIFFAVIIPIGIGAGFGYWVWRNWTGKFGQIRLGEQSSFNDEAPYIKYPVMLVAGTVAVASAIPLLASSLWRSASSALGRTPPARFTTRDSFARGRGDYAVVDEDEGELLGEDSEEDV